MNNGDSHERSSRSRVLVSISRTAFQFTVALAVAFVAPAHLQGTAPVVNAAVSAASSSVGISPGSLASIYGFLMAASPTMASGFSFPLPTSFSGTSVTLNGIPCPLLYVSADQINLQVPVNVAVGPATLAVTFNGLTGTLAVPVVAAAPGIFTSVSTIGLVTTAVAEHADGSLLTAASPALPGDTIVVYGTGIGPVSPAVNSGQPATYIPSLSISTSAYSATISGVNAPISFLGLTPGLAGLMQINVKIPTSTPSGWQPFILKINGVSSQSLSGPGAQSINIPIAGSVGPLVSVHLCLSAEVADNCPTGGGAFLQAGTGGKVLMGWSVVNANPGSISISGIGPVAESGNLNVAPASTTVYTLTASNAWNSATATFPVTVETTTPQIVSFSVASTSVEYGQSTQLTWSVTNAVNISINGQGGIYTYNLVAPSGSMTTTKLTSPETYVLSADNGATYVTKSVGVCVIGTGAGCSGSGGSGSGSSGSGSSGSGSTGSGALTPVWLGCISEFSDTHFYNWISFQNNCATSLNVVYMWKNPPYQGAVGATTIAPGGAQNTGYSPSEVSGNGGFILFVCPANYNPVTSSGVYVSQPTQSYVCKPQ